MPEWKEYLLSDVYDFASGLSKGKEDFGYGYGFLSYMSIFDNYFVPEHLDSLVNSSEKERFSCSIKRGDVFLTRTSETDADLGISSVALKDYPDATFNGFTKRLRPKGNVEILPEYAGFYFRSPKFRTTIGGMSSMTTRASLNNGMLAQLPIILPPIQIQIVISDILISFQQKINLLRRQIQTLEKLIETIFHQLIIKGVDQYSHIEKLGNVVSIKGGTTPSTSNPEFWGGNIYWTSPKDLSNHRSVYLLDTNRKITPDGLNQIGSGILPIGTVLLSSRAPIGYVAITDIPVAINQGYIAIICDKLVSNYFMYMWIKLHLDLIINAANGSIFLEISKSTFKELSIEIPPHQILDQYNELVKPLFSKIKSNVHQIKTLTKLRDTLLPKLLSGDVQLNIE